MGDTTRCLSQNCTDIAPQASMHHTAHSSEHPPAPFAMEKAALSSAQDRTSIAPPSSMDFAPRFSQGVPASLDLSARATSTSISIGRKGGKKGRRTKTAATPRSEKATGLPQDSSTLHRKEKTSEASSSQASGSVVPKTSDDTLEDIEEEKDRWEELRRTFEGYTEKGGSEDNDFDEISTMFNKVRLSDFDKFKKFPDLPVELRLKIWFRALPEARVIELERSKFRTWHCPRGSPALKCSLLLVNTESRQVFLKYYKKIVRPLPSVPALLAHGCCPNRPSRPCCPTGYYCPEIDTIYIGPSSRIGEKSICFESDVKSLAFHPLDTLLYSQNQEMKASLASRKSVVENEARLLPFEVQIKVVKRKSAYPGRDMVEVRKSLPEFDWNKPEMTSTGWYSTPGFVTPYGGYTSPYWSAS
ncbi:uncharacterized protein PAC_17045 [Phialocephala subalpina]|uniref:2EXR domain-containing protein n=1 Tax=Phialocephala subalpina TaxID=576137 RepID=A0A1L7XQ27_9HELO|nr:uncharacterized protein PAC_17045 [Phialocephala subalpina]